jgi:ABC-type branched-subunit amino acid transport system ATPase component
MAANLLEVVRLSKRFGGFVALDGSCRAFLA